MFSPEMVNDRCRLPSTFGDHFHTWSDTPDQGTNEGASVVHWAGSSSDGGLLDPDREVVVGLGVFAVNRVAMRKTR